MVRIIRISVLMSMVSFAAAAFQLFAAEQSPKTEYIADTLADRLWSVQDWGSLGLNTSVKPDNAPAPKLIIGDKEYAKGLGGHANGRIYVDLAGEYDTFEAEVGLTTAAVDTGSVIFKIVVDGKEVFDSGVMRGGQAAKKVNVPVKGAAELLLVATDAGDGIGFDMADWADARLTKSATPPKAVALPPDDVGTSARIFTTDPADEAAFKLLSKKADGSGYRVPSKADRPTWVGMAWNDIKFLRRVTLRFADAADMPKPADIKLQGEGQNGWVELPAKCYVNRDTITWLIDPKCTESQTGAGQIRWQLPPSKKPIVIRGFHAWEYSSFKSEIAELRFEAVDPKTAAVVPVEIFNGSLLEGKTGESVRKRTWDMSKPLQIKASYSTSGISRQRTVIRIGVPDGEFGVAVIDAVKNDCVYVPHAGVFVTRVPQPVTLKEYLAETAGRKTVLQRVREMPDQTFAQAMEKTHNPIQDRGPMMLSLCCDNNKFTILDDGSMLGRMNVHFGSKMPQQSCSHELQGGWRPIPIMTVKQDNLVYRQRTCVAPFDDKSPEGSPDWFRERSLCVTEYTANNPQQNDADASVLLMFPSDPNAPIKIESVKDGVVVTSAGGEILAFVETAAGSMAAAINGTNVAVTGKIPAGKAATFYVYVPAWPVKAGDFAALSGGEKWFDKTVAYWDAVMAPATQIDLPDELLTNVIRASQVHCMLAARNQDNGRLVAAWIASDRYGALDTESQAVIRGMDMMGQLDFSRRSLNYWLAQYNPQGFFFNYSIAGVGENLWTIAEHYDRTHDRDWLKQAAPIMLRACKWIQSQRQKSMTGEIAGAKPPHWGLTPPGTSADWQVLAYRFFNEAQFWNGLDKAGRALADIQLPEAADIVADAEQYGQDILRAYRWNQSRSPVQPMPDGTWVRYYPSMLYYFGPIDDYFPGQDGGRTWCYDVELGAHHLVATGLLDPAAGEVTEMMNHMEDVQFMRSGWYDYPAEENAKDFFNLGGFGKVQPYYCRNAEIYAMRDDVKPFVRAYFNALATLLNTANLSLWEHFHNGGAWNKTHETGWFLCQSRIMLVQERGEQLWLAPFVTNNWLKDGMKISVRNALTRFGKVSYEIQSSAARGCITAVITPPADENLKQIVIRLRHPDGLKISGVTVDGREHKNFDPAGDTITIAPSKQAITIRADYKQR